MSEIEARIARLDEQLASHEELLAERDRLRRALATLRGEEASGRISKEQVASYLAEHPGAKPGEIGNALGVRSGTVSAHLARGKQSRRFVSRGGNWFLREQPKRGLR
jgi:DNA-directed RNA polymerase specialized sigma24 family protein